jgi:hypothetical protein
MLWKDLNEPPRLLTEIFYLILWFGVIVGLVLLSALAIGSVIYLAMSGTNYNPN